MVLPDVNVLVYAHREDAPDHDRYREWVEGMVNRDEPYGMADLVLSGFIRVVTHPRVFSVPTPLESALEFVDQLRSASNCVPVAPGARHWEIFARLCRQGGAKGNQIPDAYLAALAIENGSDWITTDRGFARYRGLRWKHPFS
jgi:uncharacterized protein